VLRNPHDAEDAFQATFLILYHKAASFRERHTVGDWLYGVASKTALKALHTTARRREKELSLGEKEPAARADSAWRELPQPSRRPRNIWRSAVH